MERADAIAESLTLKEGRPLGDVKAAGDGREGGVERLAHGLTVKAVSQSPA